MFQKQILEIEQPICNIDDSDAFVRIFVMPRAGNHHLGVDVSDLQKRWHLPLKVPFITDIVRNLNVDFLATFDGYKINFYMIQNTDIDFIASE